MRKRRESMRQKRKRIRQKSRENEGEAAAYTCHKYWGAKILVSNIGGQKCWENIFSDNILKKLFLNPSINYTKNSDDFF